MVTEQAQAIEIFQLVFDQIADPYLLVSRQGKILACGKAGAKLLGCSPHDVINLSLSDFTEVDEADLEVLLAPALKTKIPINVGFRLTGNEARLKKVALLGFRYELTRSRADAGIVLKLDPTRSIGNQFVTLNKEIDIQKKALRELKSSERKLQQANLELLAANEKAEAANLAKSIFLSNVSHEVRTPLNAILGGVQVLKDSGSMGNQTRDLNNIEQSANKLLQIMSDVIDSAALGRSSMTLENHAFSLAHLFYELKRFFQSSANRKKLSLRFDIDQNIPLCYLGDENRIHQLLAKIIDNAIKFTETGEVQVSVTNAEESLVFSVSDTGVGIAPDVMKKILEPLTQGEETLARAFGGIGIGLSLAYQLADAMGGDIEVNSQQGKGTRVNIRFELESCECPQSVMTTAESLQELALEPEGHFHVEVDCAQLEGIVSELEKQLSQGAIDDAALTALRNMICQSDNCPQLDGITLAIDEFEFEEALRKLHELKETLCSGKEHAE